VVSESSFDVEPRISHDFVPHEEGPRAVDKRLLAAAKALAEYENHLKWRDYPPEAQERWLRFTKAGLEAADAVARPLVPA
jgi:hypothetical protein